MCGNSPRCPLFPVLVSSPGCKRQRIGRSGTAVTHARFVSIVSGHLLQMLSLVFRRRLSFSTLVPQPSRPGSLQRSPRATAPPPTLLPVGYLPAMRMQVQSTPAPIHSQQQRVPVYFDPGLVRPCTCALLSLPSHLLQLFALGGVFRVRRSHVMRQEQRCDAVALDHVSSNLCTVVNFTTTRLKDVFLVVSPIPERV